MKHALSPRLAGAACLGLTLLMIPCLKAEPERPKLPAIPDEVLAETGREPPTRRDYHARAPLIVSGKGGPTARGVLLTPAYLQNGRHLGWNFNIYYPDLRKGDVVPALGYVFEVSEVGGLGMRLRKLKNEKIPKGAAPAADSIMVPLAKGGRGQCRLHDTSCTVEEIKAAAGGEKAYADLSVEVVIPLIEETFIVKGRVRVGDLILFGRAAHEVRGIVPPDAKTRVIGWVEFSPEPVEERELIGRKIPFVRPRRERTLAPTIARKPMP